MPNDRPYGKDGPMFVLKLTYKSRNGRRMGHGFPITEKQATDPTTRADLISREQAKIDARGWRLVDWEIARTIAAPAGSSAAPAP